MFEYIIKRRGIPIVYIITIFWRSLKIAKTVRRKDRKNGAKGMSNIYRFVVLYNSKDLYIWILIQLSIIFIAFLQTKMTGNTKQSRLVSIRVD